MGKIWPGTDFSGPFEEFTQAQMSNQFAVAAAVLDGNITRQRSIIARMFDMRNSPRK